MKLFAVISLSCLAVGCATVSSHEGGAATEEGVFSVMDFGANADGVTDDTRAIQAAIDAATVKGGRVYLPPGRYRVAGSLLVKPGVVVAGVQAAPTSIEPLVGTVVCAVGGRDSESAPALFEMGQASAVTGITVWYPEQMPDDIRPYPWTFHIEDYDATIENVTLINSYNGINVGPKNSVRHRIRSVSGCVLRRGILVDGCSDIGRIENVQFHCHWWSKDATNGNWDKVFAYMIENLEAFTFGRTDWEYVTNNFVFPAKVGYKFIRTDQGACNGHFTANGADACETSVLVEDIQPMGLLFTGCQFVAFTGTNPVQVRIADTNRGNIRFVNCAFWGPSLHNAVVQGSGFVSFSDCYLSGGKEDGAQRPLLLIESGRVQINNSTFDAPQPAVSLGRDVQHAVIQGNNGRNGVRIVDNTRGNAIIRDNELAE